MIGDTICRLIRSELLLFECVSGTEGTQYAIKTFNAQVTICYTESHPVNPI